MRFDGILFVLCCLGLGAFGCLIAADLVEEFELSIYLDLAGIAFTMMAMVVAWVGLDERRRIAIESHDQYIAKLMERVQDLHLGIDECLVEIRELEKRTDVLEKSQK